MIRDNKHRKALASPVAFVLNMLMVYCSYAICRLAYVLENWTVLGSVFTGNGVADIVKGSLLFDTSAILYTNALYALLMLLPLKYKETPTWQKVAKWVFIVVNGICIFVNLADSVYFQYTGRRTTMSVFREFSNEGNLASVFGVEVLNHWYLVLLGIALIYVLAKFYVKGGLSDYFTTMGKGKWAYYIINTVCLLLFVPLCIAGMRGGFTTAVRPITISNANQYVNSPTEAAAVLNTPFSMLRTMSQKSFVVPPYFTTKEELDEVYSPLHFATEQQTDSCTLLSADSCIQQAPGKNIVILIVESFCKQYIGSLNGLDHGYTPEIDKIVSKSLTFEYSYCNGRKSIDGMPSILSGIPMFVEPFVLTPASLNDVSGIAKELKGEGYTTSFFHGAENGSMGFQAFSRSTGFDSYFGRTEYNEDPRFDGDKDFDGTWAIWDEPFLQFYCTKLTEMPQPFMSAVFTASSHHPFAVPEKYKDIYKEEGDLPLRKCIRYTDMALGRFFEEASKQTWFDNTIFVLTSDHTNGIEDDRYANDLDLYSVPIIIYDPSGNIQPGRSSGIAQQIDIMPTILNHLGYQKPYVSFGQDLLNTPEEDTWAVNYMNGIYQFVKGSYLLQFDGTAVKAVYDYRNDVMLQHNIAGQIGETEQEMERQLKAIIQSYMQRMTENTLIVR